MPLLSPLQQYRLTYQPKLPPILHDLKAVVIEKGNLVAHDTQQALEQSFSKTKDQPLLHFVKGHRASPQVLKVGVVLSGGQAPGGHNVIAGLYDALQKLNPSSQLIGFCDGPSGILKNKTLEITSDLLAFYRNQGGFDIIGSGRTKIETSEQFLAAEKTMQEQDLDGLVIIGGDDSNTNAAFLAEYFKQKGIKTTVVGVPKTIDGDLKNEFIEVSFGFDTACKIYSEIIGNILIDTLSAKKYYYFIKLMGRSASHITLECALQTHVNMALISEEVAEKKQSLDSLVHLMADMICQRAAKGKQYGAILIPEGIIEFIPEFRQMITELNHLISAEQKAESIADQLSVEARRCFLNLPEEIRSQLLLDRDPHGNVQVSKIETERLFMRLVEQELIQRKKAGQYQGKFSAQPLFCGYEGRSGLPSNFDCQYCYALGQVAALLVDSKATGYMSCVQHLNESVDKWEIAGIPIYSLLHLEWREGKEKAVIRKALVDLKGKPFRLFESQRKQWMEEDRYVSPGPIQFSGPAEITDVPSLTLIHECKSSKALDL